mmetsp:Transcript_18951/g.29617  ORF Transcript_18951/g.29617 Transcript_18951/m.29617 type:complete len:325 (+) Transcript_18951:114-1088(+)
MMIRLLAVLALVAEAAAFQQAPSLTRALGPGTFQNTLRPAVRSSSVAVGGSVGRGRAARGPLTLVAQENTGGGAPAARIMDAGIYNFNKIVIDTVYDIICFLYPVRGTDRDFARFYVLETVARVPYFAYLSVMHLRETFGERSEGLSERMRTHYAEADNELHHLLIMESLGGNSSIVDRSVAQTMAFGYYWYVTAVYAFNEQAAYHLSELIEDHAFDTYNKYLTDHEEMLKSKPVPEIARKYYVEDNPFLFDLFCTVKDKDDDGNFSNRRPQLDSLYDVFVNVRDDEKEHWKTLCNLVQYNDMQGIENSKVQGTAVAAPALPEN